MKSILEPWGQACAASSALRFIDINLRGTAQVMFQNHPLSGLLFLLAIAWGSTPAVPPRSSSAGFSAWSRPR